MSKGSRQRPVKDRQQFNDNWDAIFNKPTPPETVSVDVVRLDTFNTDMEAPKCLGETKHWGDKKD